VTLWLELNPGNNIENQDDASADLDRLKLILKAVTTLEGARLISFEDCELSLPAESDQKSLLSSLPQEISSRVRFRKP
jgi:hypothetical protein